ncbi:UDP-glucose 4-epimerase GalE [Streptomyces sp. AV19]|uniref:UDP-glucose 4-epimerase GalE n=1 Tax=Streptomyces sp. AV19 TaxID=2793068 RepID=UPI0018FE0D3A|nr:UDP-glucose 4-epimerase GalE [Streptomyces sp. AV19]MBH1939003.1 UDP-glucose 4-epimerase GalE [Streptomyces sp. AV19]MDG4536873.1 UDP-glucose 4-epimerase GalE [Streptomyces sp. AV19]
MTWLITGGAGYIGSHVVHAMIEAGEHVVVYDDLSTGTANNVPSCIPLVIGTVLDTVELSRTIKHWGITGIVHLAGKKQVGESVERPLLYYRENVEGLRTLLDAAVRGDVRRFVFSSSASVYGTPDTNLVTEGTPCAPISPYGETKLAGEWLVRATGQAHGIATATLRYFNVAGTARPELGDTGIFNLIPMAFQKLTAGEPPHIFGDDYPTPDGTCIRDYIHVADLADAHVAAARKLRANRAGADLTLNIGRGEGVSVREMIELVLKITGQDLPARVTPRRPGDPARVVACAGRATDELGWQAKYGVRDMIASAWAAWLLRNSQAVRPL